MLNANDLLSMMGALYKVDPTTISLNPKKKQMASAMPNDGTTPMPQTPTGMPSISQQPSTMENLFPSNTIGGAVFGSKGAPAQNFTGLQQQGGLSNALATLAAAIGPNSIGGRIGAGVLGLNQSNLENAMEANRNDIGNEIVRRQMAAQDQAAIAHERMLRALTTPRDINREIPNPYLGATDVSPEISKMPTVPITESRSPLEQMYGEKAPLAMYGLQSGNEKLLEKLLTPELQQKPLVVGGFAYEKQPDGTYKKVAGEGKEQDATTKTINSYAEALYGRKWDLLTQGEKMKVLDKAQLQNPMAIRSVGPPIYNVIQTSEGLQPVNVRTGKPSGAPIGEKPLPSEQITTQQQIGTLKDVLNRVRQTYDSSYVGPVAGRLAGIKEQTVGIESKQAQFNSDLAQMQNTLVYLMSGKQINEQEYNRLKRQLPDKNLPPSTFNARMDTFEKTLNSIIEQRRKASGGYGVPKAETGKATSSGNRFIIEEVK